MPATFVSSPISNPLGLQAGLFSAVSSAFVIDTQSKLEPDPNEQSAALLRAILFTLKQSALPAETAAVPPIHEDPPGEIVTASGLMYASLLISLLAAFVAMLGKQWLNRYLRNTGGSMMERCGERQRKCEGLEKWPLHLFVESLPVMLQISLLLLACGLCRQMWSVNTSVAYILITLTAFGISFYLGIVAAGASSYECPFQTPASAALRGFWKATRPQQFVIILYSRSTLSWMNRAFKRWTRRLFLSPPPPTVFGEVRSVSPIGGERRLWRVSEDPASLRTNANDIRCVSWILRNITDREAIDAAIRLAGTVRWFEGGIDAGPPYDVIAFTFESCFDSSKKIYPGSTDRAYYSARAILQTHVFAKGRTLGLIHRFPLPFIRINEELDGDLVAVFQLYWDIYSGPSPTRQVLSPTYSPAHLHWASNLLLRNAWATHHGWLPFTLDIDSIRSESQSWDKLPFAVVLDRLLVWSMLLGRSVNKRVLMIEDKPCVTLHLFLPKMHTILSRFHSWEILSELSEAIVAAIEDPFGPHHMYLVHVLRGLTRWKTRPLNLTTLAYKWCSTICKRYQELDTGEELLFLSLEINFRHLVPQWDMDLGLTHTRHHQYMADIVFGSQRGEVIADLLLAWTSQYSTFRPVYESLNVSAKHLVHLQNLDSSPRLRRLVIRSIEIIGHEGFREVGVENLIRLLNRLGVGIDDMWFRSYWIDLLLWVIESPEGRDQLSYSYWELLVELNLPYHWDHVSDLTNYNPQITISLQDIQEWDRLACWVSFVWREWSLPLGEELRDLGRATTLLFYQRPDSIRKLEEWMKRSGRDIPTTFREICEQARLEVGQRGGSL